MSESIDELKHSCEACGGPIAYPEHAAGTGVHCPHCGAKTVLGAPSNVPNEEASEAESKHTCENCSGHIGYPIHATGTVTHCPHCGTKTVLGETARVSAQPANEPAKGARSKKSRRTKSPKANKSLTKGVYIGVTAALVIGGAVFTLLKYSSTQPDSSETTVSKDEVAGFFNWSNHNRRFFQELASDAFFRIKIRDATGGLPTGKQPLTPEWLPDVWNAPEQVSELNQVSKKLSALMGGRLAVLKAITSGINSNLTATATVVMARSALNGLKIAEDDFFESYESYVHGKNLNTIQHVWEDINGNEVGALPTILTSNERKLQYLEQLALEKLFPGASSFVELDCLLARVTLLDGIREWGSKQLTNDASVTLTEQTLASEQLRRELDGEGFPKCPAQGAFGLNSKYGISCSVHKAKNEQRSLTEMTNNPSFLLVGALKLRKPSGFKPTQLPELLSANDVQLKGETYEFFYVDTRGITLRKDGRMQPRLSFTNLTTEELLVLGKCPKFQRVVSEFSSTVKRHKSIPSLQNFYSTLWSFETDPMRRLLLRLNLFSSMNRLNQLGYRILEADGSSSQQSALASAAISAAFDAMEQGNRARNIILNGLVSDDYATYKASMLVGGAVLDDAVEKMESSQRVANSSAQSANQMRQFAGNAKVEAVKHIRFLNRYGFQLSENGPLPVFPALKMTNWLSEPVINPNEDEIRAARARKLEQKVKAIESMLWADIEVNRLRGKLGYGQEDINYGLVAHYPLDAGFIDKSGGNHHGVGNAKSANGVNGEQRGAAMFDGNSSVVCNVGNLVGKGRYSISLWFFKSSISREPEFLLSKGQNNLEVQLNSHLTGANGIAFLPKFAGHGKQMDWHTKEYAAGRWNHLVCVWVPNKIPEFFINGKRLPQILGPNSSDSFPAIDDNRNALVIGRRSDNTLGFNGLLDDIRIYNRRLGQNDVQALYALRGRMN